MIKVLWFSVLVANVDLLHAGSVWTDAIAAFICATDTIRHHHHFDLERHSLLEGTHYLSDFKSRFLEPQSTIRDELDAVMHAVCSKSPAREKAGTDAPAAPKRSNEREL